MTFPLKRWFVIINIVLQISGALTIKCYYCNTRDHDGCDNLHSGQNSTYLISCSLYDVCSIVKGHWDFEDGRPYHMLWRGCGLIRFCSQATAFCCHCDVDGCNYENGCRNHGNVLVPGVGVFVCYILYLFYFCIDN